MIMPKPSDQRKHPETFPRESSVRRWWSFDGLRLHLGGGVCLWVVAAMLFTMTGCSASGEIDNTDNAVVLVITSITPSSDPFGDVLTSGGIILDDTIDVVFAAHLKAPVTGADSNTVAPTLQDIVLERYEVTYHRTDGGSHVPPGFERGISLRVRMTPHGEVVLRESSITDLVIAPSTTKAQPPISLLIDPGFESATGYINIQVNAHITFFGRTIAGDRVTATAQVGINFANFGDDNS
jgi:hypothetical protein